MRFLKNFTNFEGFFDVILWRIFQQKSITAPLNPPQGGRRTLSGLGQTLTGQVTIVSKNFRDTI